MKHTLTATLRTCAVVAALIAGLALALPAEAATTWSEPQPIEDEFVTSWFPELDTDPTGATRLVWEGMRSLDKKGVTDANGSVILLSEYGPDGWSEPAGIQVKDVYNAGRPILASDGRYVHVIARGLVDETITGSPIQNLAGLYYIRAAANAELGNYHSWSTPFRLSDGASYWAQLAILPNGDLVVVYNQLVMPSADANAVPETHLFSRRSVDDGLTWSLPVRISSSEEHAVRSSLAVSPVDGSLTLVWDQGYDNLTGLGKPAGIQTATSIDGGATWSEPRRLGEGETGTRAARGTVELSTVATNGERTVVVYRSIEDDVLLYRTSSDVGVTWSEEAVIPNAVPREFGTSHHFDKLSLVFDGSGRAILAFIGADPNAPTGHSVIVTTFEDSEWSPPEVVAAPDGFPEYPRLAIALGNQLHLTYYVRDEQFGAQNYAVWVVEGESDAASVAPVAVTPPEIPATSTPGKSEINLPELTQLPDIPPAQQPISAEQISDNPRNTLDNPIVTALWVTALTVLGVLIAVAVARRIIQLRF